MSWSYIVLMQMLGIVSHDGLGSRRRVVEWCVTKMCKSNQASLVPQSSER